MTTAEAREILQAMLDGSDPVTGEILPPEHICNYPEVIRALHIAIASISDDRHSPAEVRKNSKLNAGRAWTSGDSAQLESLFKSGATMDEMCRQLQRRERVIKRQLAMLGLIESSEKPAKAPIPGLERAGRVWTSEEDMLLRKLHSDKRPISEIAAEMRRSRYSIFCRMEKLELYGEEYGYPILDELPKWENSDSRALRKMFEAGKSVGELAEFYGRSEKSIAARLFYMGLIKESPFSKLRGDK